MSHLFGTDLLAGLFTLFSIVSMETMLSVDNAAVLAIMVRNLPEDQQPKALKYGILGAFVLRGVCLVGVSWLISMWFLKVVGGVWLIWLCIKHFRSTDGGDNSDPADSVVFLLAKKFISVFWATVVLVEAMDMAFSMDNIFAVTALTKFVGLVVVGVFIGIVSMRFVAMKFIKLMEKFPFLENLAFVVIGILGVKLTCTLYTHYHPTAHITELLDGRSADYVTSAVTMAIFFIPVITSLLFGIPKRVVPASPTSTEVEAEKTLNETN